MQTSRFAPRTRATQPTAHQLLDHPATVERFLQCLPSRNRTASSTVDGADPITPKLAGLTPASPENQTTEDTFQIVEEFDSESTVHVRRDSFKAAVHKKAALALKKSSGNFSSRELFYISFLILAPSFRTHSIEPSTVMSCLSLHLLIDVSKRVFGGCRPLPIIYHAMLPRSYPL
jgi:hypothetical protein